MKPLFILLGSFILSLLIIFVLEGQWIYLLSGNIAMCVMLCFTAIGHFAFKDGMSMMIPAFIPFKKLLVLLTGLMEIAFGILLLIPQYRIFFGWCLVVFFVLISPANIYASMKHINLEKGNQTGKGLDYLWFRMPLQLFFIAWVLVFSVYPIILASIVG